MNAVPTFQCLHCGLRAAAPQLKGMEVVVWTRVDVALPDSDTTVVITLDPEHANEPVWLGYHDGEKWRDVSGLVVEVLYWADMPRGGDLCA